MSSEYARGGNFRHLTWVSKRAPGTPQSLEALFDMMNKGNMGTGAFKFARGLFQYLTDDHLWSAYEMWVEGKFDSSVIEKREAWEKKKPL